MLRNKDRHCRPLTALESAVDDGLCFFLANFLRPSFHLQSAFAVSDPDNTLLSSAGLCARVTRSFIHKFAHQIFNSAKQTSWPFFKDNVVKSSGNSGAWAHQASRTRTSCRARPPDPAAATSAQQSLTRLKACLLCMQMERMQL